MMTETHRREQLTEAEARSAAARTAYETAKTRTAIDGYETMLLLDPPDPAEAHYRLARLFHEAGDPKAKRHVLQALEDAPRFRDAQRLLLEIRRAEKTQTKAQPAATSAKASP